MTTKELPDNTTEHEAGDFNAITIPVEVGSLDAHGDPRAQSFDKLIVFNGPKGSWVHKDYRTAPKKKSKKGKKRG